MAFLEIDNVSKSFGRDTWAVKDFNLQVERGELVSFLGPSGCGKTTTLRMVAGFETPSNGIIRVNNEDITSRPPNRRNVGMVFQAYALFPNMSVADNIGFGLKIAKKSSSEIKNRVKEMLDLIHMPGLEDRYPFAERRPAIESIRVDPLGRLWVLANTVGEERTRLELFDADLTFAGSVTGLPQPEAFTGDGDALFRIAGADDDGLDLFLVLRAE